MIYYAEIDKNSLCVGIQEAPEAINSSNLIEVAAYDVSLLGKKWTGGEWVENPDQTEPEPQDPPVTNEELQSQIAELQEQNMALMMGMVDVYAAVTTNKGE